MAYDRRDVTIIVLAKNEAEGLAKIIREVRPYGTILVVDGNSKDSTRELVAKSHVAYLNDQGRGRGVGVRLGIAHMKTPVGVLFDADGSYDPRDIPGFVRQIREGKADLVVGSRLTGGSFDRPVTWDSIVRTLGSNIAALLVNLRFGTTLTDVHYGFRAFKTKKIQKLRLVSTDHAIEQELVIASLAHGYTVAELPSREHARQWGQSKLKTRHGAKMAWDLLVSLYWTSAA